MANVITGLRIFISLLLLFCPVFSPIFYALYLIAGLSDMADGFIARRTNSVSEFGSRFDSIADFVFVAVCLIKVLPAMDIPICSVALFAAVQEGHFIRTGKRAKQKNIPTEYGG